MPQEYVLPEFDYDREDNQPDPIDEELFDSNNNASNDEHLPEGNGGI